MKLERIKISAALIMLFVFALPRISLLSEHALMAAFILLGILAVLIFFSKNPYNKLDFAIITSLGVGLIIFGYLSPTYKDFPEAYILLSASAHLAFIFLSLALLVGPWTHMFARLLGTYKYRRHIGVAAFFLAFLHEQLVVTQVFEERFTLIFDLMFPFFGFLALFVMFWLAITSWNYVQKHFSYRLWVVIHNLTFVLYVFLLIIFFSRATGLLSNFDKLLVIMFGIYWIAIAPWSLPRILQYKVNGWKQLHMLVYVAYLAAAYHIWIARYAHEAPFVKGSFVLLVIFVVCSHIIGWPAVLKDLWLRIKTRVNSIKIADQIYYKLDKVESFVEGKGRRFFINGIPVAAFLHQGKVVAMSNVCPHQGGPLAQGRIVNGYVECPWHNWEYSVKDGCGPPGFKDCVPYYDVQILDGVAYAMVDIAIKTAI